MKRKLISILSVVAVIATTLISAPATAAVVKRIAGLGPGSRIYGLDISRWQHPSEKLIDFRKMYKAGVRFVIIKGSDANDPADAAAFKYLKIDRPAAQSARIYTGFYHYATLPDSTDPAFIITDAMAQAQKVIWRLASIGGYTRKDLPLALDLENNCVRVSSAGSCTKYINAKFVTLWAQTWLAEVFAKTGRRPVLYSYPQFLENAMVRSTDLTQYPLWMAHYKLDPAIPASQPGLKTVGCYAHSWTNADCTAQWQFWQFSSCGIGAKYGIPSQRVDLNVFSGSSANFYALTRGRWQPTAADMLPINEATTMTVLSTTSATTNDPTVIVVDVFRPDGTPVVTGTVDFKSLDSTISSGTQRAVRSASGRWTLSITKLKVGNYLGLVEYLDASGTHLPNSTPVQFVINPAPTPTATSTPSPTPSPKPSPTVKPKPVDGCAGQIIN